MIDRFFLAVVLIILGVATYLTVRSLHLWVIRRRLTHPVQSVAPGLAAYHPGQPALLYFTTANCVPCRTMIKPALRRLIKELGDRFQILEINAELNTEAARYWNVLSVPTIFVLDPQGKPQHVHYGVVGSEVLRAELKDWLGQ